MLDLKEEKLDVKFKGNSYQLSYPTTAQIEKFQSDALNPDSNNVNLIKDFLCDCGMAKEVYAQLTAKHTEALFNELFGLKKN